MDKALRLIIIDELQSLRLVTKPKRVSKKGYDEKVEAERLALLDAKSWEKAAAKVKELTFDGGLEIFTDIHADWDGEDDTFDVRDLAGIERLSTLQKINLIALYPKDLRPLAKLPALEEIHASRIEDLRVLENFPALKVVRCDADETEHNREAYDRLRKNGVVVDVPFSEERRDARADEGRRETEKALKKLNASIAKKPTFHPLVERAQLYSNSGDHALAVRDIDAAIAIVKPKEKEDFLGPLYKDRAIANFFLDNFAAAVDDYTKAIENDCPCEDNRAEALLKLGKPKEALRDVEAYIRENDGGSSFSLYVRGAIHLALGNRAKARADWEKAAQDDSEEAKQALRALGGRTGTP